ncbi:PREDICTED: centrosomal protein of 162 kDa [Nicrophorus vespilloides]|uniref:Centrosomal protein of 162 kDa n=1 Tax=Nicrophorus vespilloides TaxID=110193 RepID=A0ABM1M206_NICVS|nr:PREDICTED: centrosomal protein of 162 kDa [Nicrophorus vespilloides]
METKGGSNMWWLKSNSKKVCDNEDNNKLDREITSSLAEYLENEKDSKQSDDVNGNEDDDVDIGSILEEISRISAKSPLGPYDNLSGERSIEDIMKEAERLYMESSKSFEHLSQKSKTSENVTELGSNRSNNSTPTPKSLSPLPLDEEIKKSSDSDVESEVSFVSEESIKETKYSLDFETASSNEKVTEGSKHDLEEIEKKDGVIKMLILDNKGLKEEIQSLQSRIEETHRLFEEARAQNESQELVDTLERLKDTEEANTALQLQLNETNRAHHALKTNYEELLDSNKILERKLLDVDAAMEKYKQELLQAMKQKDKVSESEISMTKLLEVERLQVKNLKMQCEKDAKSILDLNRQIKEMERIIARKHPDSVSALIVAAKGESVDSRRVLEERIKALEQEALARDAQNSQVFIDVQEKFNQMKLKYESHIDDLELHVNDLKMQLKRKVDSYDVYTQTAREDQKIPQKDVSSVAVQVGDSGRSAKTGRKDDAHLLATIRGLQADLTNKEKVNVKLQKEIEELRKTNRRLQKEREGSLKNLTDRREFRSYPEKLAEQKDTSLEDELKAVRTERDKMKKQLCRIEEDYQALKAKRLQDLNTLQEAHEREISTYLANITPLREQLEVQQVSISSLQQQLIAAKEELAVVTVERDHLNNKMFVVSRQDIPNGNEPEVVALRNKVSVLEMKYEERENRLRAIVHGLAQKSVMNRSCDQCATRQQQLIGYKAELDQLIATLRCLK